MTDIPEGHGVIAGRSEATAAAALEAAQKAGVSPGEVVSVENGYLVPGAVLDAFHQAQGDVDPATADYTTGPHIAPPEDPAEGSAAPPPDVTVPVIDYGTPIEEGSAGPPEDVELPEQPNPEDDPAWGVAGPPEDPAAPLTPEPLTGAPTASWRNADIEAWAQDNTVDLGGATTKADMLAAISAADTKEE